MQRKETGNDGGITRTPFGFGSLDMRENQYYWALSFTPPALNLGGDWCTLVFFDPIPNFFGLECAFVDVVVVDCCPFNVEDSEFSINGAGKVISARILSSNSCS